MDQIRSNEPEGAPACAQTADAGAPSGGAGPERRFSARRKLAVVTRLLRGEPLETVARELNLRQESPGKEDGCSRKPFIAVQGVQLPPGKGAAHQPEASLAWATATPLVKRRQQTLKPWGSPDIMSRWSLRSVGTGGSTDETAMARSRRSGRGLGTGQRCGMDCQET